MDNGAHMKTKNAGLVYQQREYSAQLRGRVIEVNKVLAFSKYQLAKEWACSFMTVKTFLDGQRETGFRILCRIEAWVDGQEDLLAAQQQQK